MNNKRRKAAEAASLSRICKRILKGKKCNVIFLPEGDSSLGFTNGDESTVYIAWEHEIYEGLSEKEKTFMRMGVCAHEILHQCLTNFAYANVLTSRQSREWARIFMMFANTLEDPAIEYFAPQIFGGKMLEALRFTIKHIYKVSKEIDNYSSALLQLINAMVQFGDMGIVKGNFTYPEAYETFLLIAPIFNKGIVCSDSKKRLDYALQCMEIAKPLWEKEIADAEEMEKALEEIKKQLESDFCHFDSDEYEVVETEDDSLIAKRRKKAVLVIESLSEKAVDDEGTVDSETRVETDGQEETIEGTIYNETILESIRATSEDANDIVDEEYTIDEEMLNNIEQDIEKEEKKLSSEMESKMVGTLPDFDVIVDGIEDNVLCLNRKVSYTTPDTEEKAMEEYRNRVNLLKPKIKNFTKELERIFESDREEYIRHTSGCYNIIRGAVGTTAKIFDKKKDKAGLNDCEVVILVDQSGSMICENRMEQARDTAIILSEAFHAMNIKHYVLGFSADEGKYQAVHNHFVGWEASKKDRSSLIGMQAGGNNFDGYSIRYAGNLLKDRTARTKILFVISDGEPACYSYQSYNHGYRDTKNAIKQMRKHCIVFGIAVGNGVDPIIHQQMYGKDFVYCENPKMLSNVAAKKLKKIILSQK